MSRRDDADELARLLERVAVHGAKARACLARVPEGGRDDGAWLDALDEVRELLDVVTGVRVRFGQWSDEANRTGVRT
jgi:hypothetical protein